MFEPKKFADVFEDMRDRTSGLTDFTAGSVTRTMYESFAYEIALLYEKMHQTYLSAFVDTAQGAQLDLVVAILGIRRGLPDFAEGTVTFTRDLGKDDAPIPLGTLVTTEEPKKSYQTFAPATLAVGGATIEVKVRAVERGDEQVTAAETLVVMPRPVPGVKSVSNRDATEFHGKHRETDEELRERAKNALISSGKATSLSIENALLRLPGVHDVKVHERFRFADGKVAGDLGVIEVYVDTDEDPESFRPTVDQVRAAGIFVILKATRRLKLDGTFRIKIDPQLTLSAEDRTDYEASVRQAIEGHLAALRMGEPLLFSQLTKTVLNVDGITDLDFKVTVADGQDVPGGIAIEEFDRFTAGNISVTSSVVP